MGIIFKDEIKKSIFDELGSSEKSIQIITAYCKENAFQYLDKKIKNNVIEKKVIVRFRLGDIVGGATDFTLYEYCKNNGWDMYIRFDLHAKTYVFDNKRCIIGSANLTNSGLNLSGNGNYEMASLMELEDSDLYKIQSIFSSALLMDDEIYNKMKENINKCNNDELNNRSNEWSEDIRKMFKPRIEALFTYELPDKFSPKEYIGTAIEFLELPSTWEISELKEAFRWSKSFLWLFTLLTEHNRELYFGEITACLHNILINDPKPYRKDVKIYLQNLLNWIEVLEYEEIVIDRPNYSQRVRIK